MQGRGQPGKLHHTKICFLCPSTPREEVLTPKTSTRKLLPLYNEKKGTIVVKERAREDVAARLVQVAIIAERNLMRPTLHCNVVMRHSLPSPLPRVHEALHAQLFMSLLHRRLGHSGQGALHRQTRMSCHLASCHTCTCHTNVKTNFMIICTSTCETCLSLLRDRSHMSLTI